MSEPNLYRVRVSFDLCVLASDERDAEELVRSDLGVFQEFGVAVSTVVTRDGGEQVGKEGAE